MRNVNRLRYPCNYSVITLSTQAIPYGGVLPAYALRKFDWNLAALKPEVRVAALVTDREHKSMLSLGAVDDKVGKSPHRNLACTSVQDFPPKG